MNSHTEPLVLAVPAGYDTMRDAVERVFARFPLDVQGKHVFVKPNMLGNFPPERHVTTHPSLVRAVVAWLHEAGARVTVGDNPGIQGIVAEDAVARRTGILDASDGAFKIISRDVRGVALPNGEQVTVSQAVLDCDLFITLPKMKTHLHTFITGAVKNSYGLVVGAQKPALHLRHAEPDAFAGIVADIYAIRRPDLCIMDAVIAMEGDGPNSPHLRPAGRILASYDGVALDHCAARIMRMDPARIPLLAACVARGYGRADYVSDGPCQPLAEFQPARTYFGKREHRSILERVLYKFICNKRLHVVNRRCRQCMRCAEWCPAKAITQVNGRVVLDHKRCVLCYCCKETCPEHAIAFSAGYAAMQSVVRWLNR